MGKSLKELIQDRAVRDMLMEHGAYLLKNKIALSVNQAVEQMGGLLTVLTDAGEVGIEAITTLQADLKNKHLVMAGASIKQKAQKHNMDEFVEEIMEEIDVNSMTEGDAAQVELVTKYQNARAEVLELEAQVINAHRPTAKAKVFELFDKYKKHINSGFVSQFR